MSFLQGSTMKVVILALLINCISVHLCNGVPAPRRNHGRHRMEPPTPIPTSEPPVIPEGAFGPVPVGEPAPIPAGEPLAPIPTGVVVPIPAGEPFAPIQPGAPIPAGEPVAPIAPSGSLVPTTEDTFFIIAPADDGNNNVPMNIPEPTNATNSNGTNVLLVRTNFPSDCVTHGCATGFTCDAGSKTCREGITDV